MPAVRITIQKWSLDLPERDCRRLLTALRGDHIASDPVGTELARSIEDALRGDAGEIRLGRLETAAVFASLCRLQDTESSFSPDLGRLRSALGTDLGVL